MTLTPPTRVLSFPRSCAGSASNLPSASFQCTESLDRKDVLALKWTNTLLLGNNNSGAIVIEVPQTFFTL